MLPQTQEENLFDTGLTIDERSKSIIRGIASWAIVVVVASVIGYCFTLYEYLIRPAGEGSSAATLPVTMKAKGLGTILFTIALGLLMNFFLFRFATSARAALNSLDNKQLTGSFRQLRYYFSTATIFLVLTGVSFYFILKNII